MTTKATETVPSRDHTRERSAVWLAQKTLVDYRNIDANDAGAYAKATGGYEYVVEFLLTVVANLQAVADYYEQRDARFDQAAARIQGGAR